MKTANLFSLSLFVALAGLMTSVGCSTPSVGEMDDSSAAETEGDDDDDDSTTKSSKKTTKSTSDDDNDTPATNTAGDDDDTTAPTGGDAAACSTCLSANAKAVKFDQCASNCQDAQCEDQCFETSGCGADQSCEATLQKCASACGQGDQTGDDDDAPVGDDDDAPPGGEGEECFFQCVGTTGAAAKYLQCSDQCQDEQCDEECFQNACGANPDACESKLDSCDQQCGF